VSFSNESCPVLVVIADVVPKQTRKMSLVQSNDMIHDKTQFLQLTVDLGCAPIRVVIGQTTDEDANLFVDLRPASAWPRAPTPVEAEPSAMPADDGFGLDNEENFGPTGPATAEGNPKDPVQPVQSGPGTLAFEHGELLP
jgi:hypothetical protein